MRILAIYDNGGKTVDRYTVVTDQETTSKAGLDGYTGYNSLGLDDSGGDVFSQWGEARLFRKAYENYHLGRPVTFESLNSKTQEHIAKRVFNEEA